MKIHTTQNLNSFRSNQPTDSITIPEEIRLNYSEQMSRLLDEPESHDSVSFRGKKNPIKDGKKIIKSIKKAVGEVSKEAKPEVKRGDKFLMSPFFDKLLNVADYETVVQSAMAAAVCMVLRPATIMSFPGKKNKDDNVYASAHSIASGTVGLITTILLTTPFKAGADHVRKVMLKDLNEKTLKRLYPHLDLATIGKEGSRNEVKQWLDKSGNKFTDEIKDCAKLPEFKSLSEVSEETFNKVLKTDVDWASQKGKSFNDVVLKDGRKFYDAVDMSELGMIVEEEGMQKAQILFKDMDKEYLESLIKDSKDTNWGKLDINSVYTKDGELDKVVDFRQWKDTNGNQWKLDLDEVFVTSPYETANYKPRISGKKRLDDKENIYKFTTYQKNGQMGRLGTEITSDMVKAERTNEGHFKLLTWLPDLAFRIPIAVTTIALIPWVLKNIFHVQKSSAKKAEQEAKEQEALKETHVENTEKVDTVESTEKAVSFKGKEENTEVVTDSAPSFKGEEGVENAVSFRGKAPKKSSWFIRKFGELYGKPLIESENVSKISEKLSKWPGSITQHMATLGSFITSSVYVQQTLNKKDLDKERRNTLAINQVLCFIIPTIAAYTVDKFLQGFVKSKEYRYAGLKTQQANIANYEGKKVGEEIYKGLGKKLKGIRILASLAVFTMIYRYATPVIITPIANWIGNKVNAKHDNKAANAQKAEEKKAA